MIPLDWDIVEFEEICQIRKQKVNPLFQSGEFCVELEHLEPETGLLLGNTVTKPNSSIKTVFQNGDVLFGKLRAYLRKYWLANQDGVCSTEIWAFVATNKAINPFLFYVVQTEQFIKAASEAYGTHMPRSDWNVVKNYLLPLPPLPEQTAIATALSDTDALISSLQTLIAKKQAVKLAAMQNLLSGKIRLPAFAQRPDGSLKTTRQTELGCVPEDWEVLELGSVAFIKTGSKNNQDKKENGQYPFFVRSATVEQIDTYSYDCEAILIPGEGNIGSIFHYINGKFDAHQRVYVIRDFYNVIGKFVFFALKQNFGKHAMENTVKATVDSLRLPT